MAVELVTTAQAWVGLSSDTKPASPPVGSTFLETDTGALYVYAGGSWKFKPSGNLLRASKTRTFTGAANLGQAGTNTTWFTVTGEVLVLFIVGFCTTDLTEAAATATITLGITGETALFIAATNAVTIDANEFWVDTTPVLDREILPAAVKDIAISADVVSAVAAQNINGGTLRIDCWWLPLSADGNVVPAS